MKDAELVPLLAEIDPKGREILRRLMRAEQFERDEFSAALARYSAPVADELADLLDIASMNEGVRRQLARVLGELETT